MCKGETNLAVGLFENESIIKRLEKMVEEGLVLIHEDRVLITQLGRSFLRNICMAFDLKLQNSKNEKELFSQAI
ncbi:coproporphyrinogen III oxidase [compost metagenome]